ncbi:MAG: ATP-binding protein [Acidobacteriota bacterium]|nr:ATP-binding protein [Acidobacteriota bacterium]
MLPGSHLALISAPLAAETHPPSAALLADAFSEFIATSSRLEASYRELQSEVYGLGVELAERNAALNASLAQNEAMRLALEQVVDSMPCGVMVVDNAGSISMSNAETSRLLELDAAHSKPATLREIAVRSGLSLGMFFAEDATDTSQEFSVHSTAGARCLEIRNRRLFHQPNREGKPDQTILILRDITAQKRAEHDREAARNAMAAAEVTAILAHEIRNPLASLELFAELIEHDGARRSEWISNLRAGIRSLSATVDNVLSFQISGPAKLVLVALAGVVGDAIEFVRPLAEQAGIVFEWRGRDSKLCVNGAESALRQVMLNLFANAIRHTPAGGKVTVSLRGDSAGRAIVRCSDTGCGIRRDQIGRVFERGFSGNGDSSGLGLAVCERIMRQHGGRISVSNRAHSGVCFRLDFPALERVAA